MIAFNLHWATEVRRFYGERRGTAPLRASGRTRGLSLPDSWAPPILMLPDFPRQSGYFTRRPGHHDDGNISGRILRRIHGWSLHRDDNFDLAAHKSCRQRRWPAVVRTGLWITRIVLL